MKGANSHAQKLRATRRFLTLARHCVGFALGTVSSVGRALASHDLEARSWKPAGIERSLILAGFRVSAARRMPVAPPVLLAQVGAPSKDIAAPKPSQSHAGLLGQPSLGTNDFATERWAAGAETLAAQVRELVV